MKIEVVPTIEIVCTLSDGTALKSSSKEALVKTISNKLRGNSNLLSHYAREIDRLNLEFDLLKKDLASAEALEE